MKIKKIEHEIYGCYHSDDITVSVCLTIEHDSKERMFFCDFDSIDCQIEWMLPTLGQFVYEVLDAFDLEDFDEVEQIIKEELNDYLSSNRLQNNNCLDYEDYHQEDAYYYDYARDL